MYAFLQLLHSAITLSFSLRLQVFVEFENASQRCSWVQVYDDGVKAVLVEDYVVWANHSGNNRVRGAPASATAWPALVSDLCVNTLASFSPAVQK